MIRPPIKQLLDKISVKTCESCYGILHPCTSVRYNYFKFTNNDFLKITDYGIYIQKCGELNFTSEERQYIINIREKFTVEAQASIVKHIEKFLDANETS